MGEKKQATAAPYFLYTGRGNNILICSLGCYRIEGINNSMNDFSSIDVLFEEQTRPG